MLVLSLLERVNEGVAHLLMYGTELIERHQQLVITAAHNRLLAADVASRCWTGQQPQHQLRLPVASTRCPVARRRGDGLRPSAAAAEATVPQRN